jgi:hypothetical protein
LRWSITAITTLRRRPRRRRPRIIAIVGQALPRPLLAVAVTTGSP